MRWESFSYREGTKTMSIFAVFWVNLAKIFKGVIDNWDSYEVLPQTERSNQTKPNWLNKPIVFGFGFTFLKTDNIWFDLILVLFKKTRWYNQIKLTNYIHIIYIYNIMFYK